MEFSHIPVLFEETMEGLSVKPDGIYVDGTAGGGGHSSGILQRLSEKGRLYCIDQDPSAVAAVTKKFENNKNVIVIQGNFGDMEMFLKERNVEGADGILLDIGVSSHQLDTPERGFSFHEDAPLDMRMSMKGATAADLVNNLPVNEIAKILSRYGEEKYAVSIAKGIERARNVCPIETTLQLAEIIKNSVPQKVRREGHPARKSFQALRIAVNGELDRLEQGLQGAFNMLKSGGRLAVITFHSLEDRIVKQTFAGWAQGCTCPKDFPVCVCHNKPKVRLVNKKPIEASKEELEVNQRSRSAKLRICEKI